MPKHTHTLPPATPLSQQVGGHAGVHVTEDNSLLLKPALPREIAFYQFVRDVDDPSTGLYALRDWIPKFFGLLNLEGRLADASTEEAPAIIPVHQPEMSTANGNGADFAFAGVPTQTLVLQNLLYGYRKPCVLDVKLGTILYDEDASEEKKARMIKKAAESTSLPTGMRLTGFQVYSNHSSNPIAYGREYGYSLKPEQLQEGIRNFFPCSISTGQPNSALLDTSPPSTSNTGLPADILLTLLTSLHSSLTDLRKLLQGAHVRMVGGSILIIYEGDWEAAVAASGRGGRPNDEDEDDHGEEGVENDQIEVEVNEQGEIIMESIPDSSSSSSSRTDLRPRLYTVSLIDFAHTRVVPEQGPDEGILKGMDSLISLVYGRKGEIEAFIKRETER